MLISPAYGEGAAKRPGDGAPALRKGKLMKRPRILLLLVLLIPGLAAAERKVAFTGDFESGEVRSTDSRVDGFRVRTLPAVQKDKEIAVVSSGGAGPDSGIDTRVVREETVERNGNGKGEIVRPRSGKYFLRSALYKHKDYSQLQNGRDKPRSGINVSGDKFAVDFDEEGWLGFSIYLPGNLEHETAYDGSRGSTKVLQVQSDGASNILLILAVYVPPGKSESHWLLQHLLNDGVRKEETRYDLGPAAGDLGKWTDFVLRYRFNPFSRTTNAANVGGKDKVYEGNKGILQLWKATGPVDGRGNREMRMTTVNLENEPVGRVPHKTSKINWHFRIYKGNWKSQPTNIEGPIWIGFDAIRDGRAAVHGTSYVDVHPGGLYCTHKCPKTVTARAPSADAPLVPKPPNDVGIRH